MASIVVEKLSPAQQVTCRGPAALFAFDLLSLNRADFRPRPLLQRKAALHGLLPSNRRIRYAGHFIDDCKPLWQLAVEMELEGTLFRLARSMSEKDPRHQELLRLLRDAERRFRLQDEVDGLQADIAHSRIANSAEVAALKAEHTDQIRALITAPTVPAPEIITITVREAMDRMFASGDLKPRSQTRYRSVLTDFSKVVGWDTQLHTIDSVKFAEYVDRLKSDKSRSHATQGD